MSKSVEKYVTRVRKRAEEEGRGNAVTPAALLASSSRFDPREKCLDDLHRRVDGNVGDIKRRQIFRIRLSSKHAAYRGNESEKSCAK